MTKASVKLVYQEAKPFPHIIIDSMFNPTMLDQCAKLFPIAHKEGWWNYDNVLEKKFARDDVDSFPDPIKLLIWELNSRRFVDFLEHLTGISGLIPDHRLNGGGMHSIARGGHLDVHADYNYHPVTKLDRRLNVIVYLNKNWQESWGGHLQLWNKSMTECQQEILPIFNRMVVFNVTDWTFHGHPVPLKSPHGVNRKSLALYYYTNGRPADEVTPPHSVLFQKLPNVIETEETAKLREQRSKGRLNK